MRKILLFVLANLIVPISAVADAPRGIILAPQASEAKQLPNRVVPQPLKPIVKDQSSETQLERPIENPTRVQRIDPAGATKVALILGNSIYDHAPNIKNPVNDAEAIAATLEDIGFSVWTGTDLDLSDTLTITRDFVARTREAEVVLFYYGGHAIEVSGQNLLVPTDADIQDSSDLDRKLIPLDQIMRLLEQNGQTVIVLLDACRDDPFGTTQTREITPATRGLAPVAAGAGTMITFATAPGSVAFDGTGDHSPFAEALMAHISTPGLPIEVAMVRLRRSVAESTGFRQLPWTHSSLLEEIVLVPGVYLPSSNSTLADGPPIFDPDLAEILANANTIEIAETKIHLAALDEASAREELIWRKFQDGMNYVEAGGRSMKVWVEANSAFLMSTDYSESHAVIIAVDEYPKDSGQRKLDFMVEHARRLATQLANMGIPRENITELYNSEATKEAIHETLDPFWAFENSGQADRLVVYFGGHGTSLKRVGQDRNIGVLLPYDYNPDRPLKTGIWLEELRSRSFDYSRAHHTLILIDACASGLALPSLLNGNATASPSSLSVKQRWQRIRADMEQRHRAMIVAGTEDEDVLWLNGGLFTRTLLQALAGEADKNSDGLIRFDELALHLRSEVFDRAVALGHTQRPVEWSQGDGRIVFELSRFE